MRRPEVLPTTLSRHEAWIYKVLEVHFEWICCSIQYGFFVDVLDSNGSFALIIIVHTLRSYLQAQVASHFPNIVPHQ